jgi:hypothetical protein
MNDVGGHIIVFVRMLGLQLCSINDIGGDIKFSLSGGQASKFVLLMILWTSLSGGQASSSKALLTILLCSSWQHTCIWLPALYVAQVNQTSHFSECFVTHLGPFHIPEWLRCA